MLARYRHFKTPCEIQLGADQSMTSERGKGVKHVRCEGFEERGMEVGWRRENGLRWRTRVMDEATNCDEIPRQFGEVWRDVGDVRNPGMIPGADRVSGYD